MAKKKKKKNTVKSSGISQKKEDAIQNQHKQANKKRKHLQQLQRFSFHQEVEIKGIRSDNAEMCFLFLPSSKREVYCVCVTLAK